MSGKPALAPDAPRPKGRTGRPVEVFKRTPGGQAAASAIIFGRRAARDIDHPTERTPEGFLPCDRIAAFAIPRKLISTVNRVGFLPVVIASTIHERSSIERIFQKKRHTGPESPGGRIGCFVPCVSLGFPGRICWGRCIFCNFRIPDNGIHLQRYGVRRFLFPEFLSQKD